MQRMLYLGTDHVVQMGVFIFKKKNPHFVDKTDAAQFTTTRQENALSSDVSLFVAWIDI